MINVCDKINRTRYAVLGSLLHRLKQQADAGNVSNFAIIGLILCWGNLFYSAGWRYLRQVVKHTMSTQEDILECGSGLTTVILAALTASTDRKLLVLEHHSEWLDIVDARLKTLDCSNVNLIHAPLARFGAYSWYSIPENLFERCTLDLIVCDGPPSSTHGGRFGLIPKTSSFLSNKCTILLDDTHRKGEKRVLEIWRQLVNFHVKNHLSFISKSSALIIHRTG